MNPRARIRLVTALAVLAGLLALMAPRANAAQPGPFTLIVLPDTQNYVTSDAGAAYFQSQVDWVADEQTARNIIFVSHVGDIADSPTDVAQWDRADTVLSSLETAGVPYGLAPGNHDMEPGGAAPEFDARFGLSRFAGQPWFGGGFEPTGTRATYQTAAAGGHDLLFVHIRHLLSTYGETDDLLAWVTQVLEAHPDHLAFVTTHEFTTTAGDVGIAALQTALESSCNVAAVFSGHRFGAAHGTFLDQCGRPVLHVLTNYQNLANGGDGYVRTVEVDPATLAASLSVYSPVLDSYRTGTSEQFDFALAPINPPGDVSCDSGLTLADALWILQFVVGTRSDSGGCPITDEIGELFVARGDVDDSGATTAADALLVLKCVVGQTTVLCPEP